MTVSSTSYCRYLRSFIFILFLQIRKLRKLVRWTRAAEICGYLDCLQALALQTWNRYSPSTGKWSIGAKVVTNARTPGARCYGYVTMSTSEDAAKCIQHLHRTELHGRVISVEKVTDVRDAPAYAWGLLYTFFLIPNSFVSKGERWYAAKSHAQTRHRERKVREKGG